MLVEFFKGIFGGEKSKTENLKTIISIEKISPTELLIIGDSISDLKVAYNSGTKFIGIDGGDGKLRNKKLKYLLKDCSHLYEVIERMCRET
jgi:phosphoglycolate phosphatase-like HAD superfamily hydrolase